MGVKYSPRFDATSPTCTQRVTSGCRVMIWWTVSNSPWMSPRAPINMGGTGRRGWIGGTGLHHASALRTRGGRRRGHEQIRLVPDEIVLAVHRQLVVLAHEDGTDRAGLFAVAAEDAAGLVDLIDRGIAGAGLDVAGVLRRFEINGVRRAGYGAESAGHTLLEIVLVPHQDL